MCRNYYLNLWIQLYDKLKYGKIIIFFMLYQIAYSQDTLISASKITIKDIREIINVIDTGNIDRCSEMSFYTKSAPKLIGRNNSTSDIAEKISGLLLDTSNISGIYSAAYFDIIYTHNWIYSQELHHPLISDSIISIKRRICGHCLRHEELVKFYHEYQLEDEYINLLMKINKRND